MPLLTPKERLETIELGVWKVSFLKSTPFNVRERISDFGSAFPYFHRLALEVYTLEPVLAILFVLNRLWKAVEGRFAALPLQPNFTDRRDFRVSFSSAYKLPVYRSK